MFELHGVWRQIIRSLMGAVFASALAAVGLTIGMPSARAQSADSLRLVVPYPAGGGSDRAARLIAERLRTQLNTAVVVENLTGAGGRVAMQQVARMPADANVLVLANPALMVVVPLVYKNIGYDADRDFQPVSEVSTYQLSLAVGAAVPVREFNHLAAWLRANPEKATFGVPATGSIPHFFALMIAGKAGSKVQVVGYRGSAPLNTDLIGGHVPAAIDAFDSQEPLHTGGKIRILATSGAQRSLPNVPTFKEAGLDLTAQGWSTFFAKSTMPADKVKRYGDAIKAVMSEKSIREQFTTQKVDPVAADASQTAASLKAFKAQWVPVIRGAGLQLE